MPVKIYLADLTHTGLGVATEAFPLNIGLVASYAKKRFGNQVECSLFKYPEDLQQALAVAPPDILGCSNYTWNSNLAYHFLRRAKASHPQTVTVFGGTNYPFHPKKQREALQYWSAVDVHTFYEGELAFASLVERYLSAPNRAALFAEPIPGCHFLDRASGELVAGHPPERIRSLDEIPSPYATGLLDKFFDGRLTPLLETARGCPFTCNFCNAGNTYFNRVNQFSDAYVREEWEYVAREASKSGLGHLTLADNNFGMIPRDSNTAELMYELREKYGWPRSVTAWTGKNSKKRVIDVTRLLGDTLTINMAVQSMAPRVLMQIKRSNISLADYQSIADELNTQGRPQVAEVIVPLPGETFASHVAGVNRLLDSNLSTVVVHTLQMLYGTPYKDDDVYVQEHGFIRRHRIVPLDFGIYDGTPIFDTEEVSVGTKLFSMEEYVESRKLLLLIDLCYNGGIFEALKQYVRGSGLAVSAWIQQLFAHLRDFPPAVTSVVEQFADETRSELWESDKEMIRHYSRPENYQKLVRGEAGGNVLYKYKTMMLSQAMESWVNAVFEQSAAWLLAHSSADRAEEMSAELRGVKAFVRCSLADAFELHADDPAIEEPFVYDVPTWLARGGADRLADHKRSTPFLLRFSFEEAQLVIRRDALRRYGAGRPGIVKLIQRLGGGVSRCLRTVSAGSA